MFSVNVRNRASVPDAITNRVRFATKPTDKNAAQKIRGYPCHTQPARFATVAARDGSDRCGTSLGASARPSIRPAPH